MKYECASSLGNSENHKSDNGNGIIQGIQS
jgi:hypothetical protein